MGRTVIIIIAYLLLGGQFIFSQEDDSCIEVFRHQIIKDSILSTTMLSSKKETEEMLIGNWRFVKRTDNKNNEIKSLSFYIAISSDDGEIEKRPIKSTFNNSDFLFFKNHEYKENPNYNMGNKSKLLNNGEWIYLPYLKKMLLLNLDYDCRSMDLFSVKKNELIFLETHIKNEESIEYTFSYYERINIE